jgi:cytochrome c peroxidase
LEEVVDFYSDDVFPHPNNDFGWTIGQNDFTGFGFDAEEKAALVAFMKTLTDESFLTNEKWSDPFQEVNSSPFLPLEEKITIFPNPFKDKATVEFDNASGANYSLRLTTVEGRVLQSYQTSSNSLLIEKGNLGTGVYMLEIKKDNRKKVEKIILQ